MSCQAGWQEWAALPESEVVPIEVLGPLSHHLGVLGLNGLTAYFGLELGAVKPGETVVVSAAAGATGNVAGQLAKRAGARVVGITSAGKLDVLRRLGFDVALDRRALDLKAACPDGIDVYFDNVGGPLLDAVLPRMAEHGRIVCCGTLSAYDGDSPPGPRAVPGLLISRRLRMEGFVVLDYVDRWPAAARELAAADLDRARGGGRRVVSGSGRARRRAGRAQRRQAAGARPGSLGRARRLAGSVVAATSRCGYGVSRRRLCLISTAVVEAIL